MNNTKITLTFSQCKAIVNAGLDLRESVESLNNQPEFMLDDLFGMSIDSVEELSSIIQCGCASNAHASVYYYGAGKCMAEHGDDVLEYLENSYGEIPAPREGSSWNSLASDYLSAAIESWCGNQAEIIDAIEA